MRMIVIGAVVLAGLGTTLYQVKTSIDARQGKLNNLYLTIATTKRDIAFLEAEWAYLSRPDRIMNLANALLDMQPIGQDRILPLDAIPMRNGFKLVTDKPVAAREPLKPKRSKAHIIRHRQASPETKTRPKVSMTLGGNDIKVILMGDEKP